MIKVLVILIFRTIQGSLLEALQDFLCIIYSPLPTPSSDTLIENLKLTQLQIELDCTICLNIMQKEGIILGCGHIFHQDCIQKWLKRNQICPVCRQTVTLQSLQS
ncbi:hypothetical protein FGO68_gene7702 [Halteria grandinella]|uniref:RING-type domain-containing protein n=1 Tax=Halteria grandinella TaxID=5974 RepID=A0A8J8NIX8_HALGN|nr:hypothetical protein FGO68_gene7702 [Halteria grandinella]